MVQDSVGWFSGNELYMFLQFHTRLYMFIYIVYVKMYLFLFI